MEAIIFLVFILVWIVVSWLFYMWGAAIAEGKGRSRALGWWAVFFGLIAILILALQPAVTREYVPQHGTAGRGSAERLERLANLREKGALTDEEFEEQKRAILGNN